MNIPPKDDSNTIVFANKTYVLFNKNWYENGEILQFDKNLELIKTITILLIEKHNGFATHQLKSFCSEKLGLFWFFEDNDTVEYCNNEKFDLFRINSENCELCISDVFNNYKKGNTFI